MGMKKLAEGAFVRTGDLVPLEGRSVPKRYRRHRAARSTGRVLGRFDRRGRSFLVEHEHGRTAVYLAEELHPA